MSIIDTLYIYAFTGWLALVLLACMKLAACWAWRVLFGDSK